jgi:hypothetical protein
VDNQLLRAGHLDNFAGMFESVFYHAANLRFLSLT